MRGALNRTQDRATMPHMRQCDIRAFVRGGTYTSGSPHASIARKRTPKVRQRYASESKSATTRGAEQHADGRRSRRPRAKGQAGAEGV
jgi:hypothetical protein